jgi:hypothetical protein
MNPILLTYKYVHAEPAFQLPLKITRPQEIDVQVAAIETAHYSILFTRDGMAVSRARFIVRNNRRQFLRLELPDASTIWSVFVDGMSEKPAHASEDGDGSVVLIKRKKSSHGFPVEIVYATQVNRMQALGKIGARLPTPDMVVRTRAWMCSCRPTFGIANR